MNWIEYTKNDELMTEYSSKLALDLAKEQGIDYQSLTDEECQAAGAELTAKWFEGKTSTEAVDYLVNTYGSETDKKSYKEWLIERS